MGTDIETVVASAKMTIQIPDDLSRGLECLAALQRKSVERVAVESLCRLFDRSDSPQAVLLARSLPYPSAATVDDMEAAIVSARLPVRDGGATFVTRDGDFNQIAGLAADGGPAEDTCSARSAHVGRAPAG